MRSPDFRWIQWDIIIPFVGARDGVCLRCLYKCRMHSQGHFPAKVAESDDKLCESSFAAPPRGQWCHILMLNYWYQIFTDIRL